MAQKGFYVDTTVCTSCKTCQVACQDKYDLPAGIIFRRVFNYGGGKWTKKGSYHVPEGVFRYFVSMSCNHCAAPACLVVCPVNAISKDGDTGIVKIDEKTCIGCRACETACPYTVPVYDEEKKINRKCDMCADYVAKGLVPMCVDACHQRALEFGDLEELKSKHPDTTDGIEPLPVPSTGPSLLLKAHKDAQVSGKGTGHILNVPEEL